MSKAANPDLRELGQAPAIAPTRLGISAPILRLVKNAPERAAIEAGQVDAVIDPASGEVFLLPEAKQALQEEQARIRSLLARSADWRWEQDENYRFVSHAGIAADSLAPYNEDIDGKRLWDMQFHNMQEADWSTHQMQLEWRFAFRDLELKCTDNHGKTCWVSISGEPIYDKYDEFKGYRGITRDITQRKFAEAIAQASKDFHNDKDDDEYTFDNDIAEREPIANSLLAAVPRKDYLNLLAGLTPVTLTYGQVLYEPGQLIEHVYFPSDCLISLLTTVDGNRALGVGLIGREGMLGIPLALGIEFSSVRTLVQASGTAMRMNAACFRNEVADSLPLQQELHRFIHRKLAHARQNAACNRFHVLEERLARWLLMTSDRLCSDQFHLTHAFLANMLGVHRAGVTQAAFTLQQRKLITYRRGNISILDRQGLEAASCGCYQINKPA